MLKRMIMVLLVAVCLPVSAADLSAPGLVEVDISHQVQIPGDVNKQSVDHEAGIFADHIGGSTVALDTLLGGSGGASVVMGVCDSCHNEAGRPNRHSRSPGGSGSLSNRVDLSEHLADAPFQVG